MCTIACPFGNAVYDSVTESILKCDTCGGDPACVQFCPSQALEFVDDNISTRSRKMAFAGKFKSAFEGA
jgi:Fe-S-cluster-containing hydrogenase component 2